MARREFELRGFVAMKIGHSETDALFKKSLAPALRSVGVTPIRIDKVEHNDDIDDRILAEIGRADVVVADLTFARPSAYFEAGYAAGIGKPVIYTARKDHFRDKDDDPLGNLRVHFDLQMKNIIDWSEPGSSAFRNRLEKRLNRVLAPIIRTHRADKAAADARAQFSRQPMASRLEVVSKKVEACLRSLGYRLVSLESRDGEPYGSAPHVTYGANAPEGLLGSGFVGAMKSPGAINAVWARIDVTLTLAGLRPIDRLLRLAPPHDMNPPPGVRPNRVIEHVLLVSLRPVPRSRIHSAFTTFEQVGESEFTWSTQQRVPVSHVNHKVLLIGRAWQGTGRAGGMGFDCPKPGTWVSTEYTVTDRNLEIRPRPRYVVAFFHGGDKIEAEKPTVHGRVKDVPRRVHVHVIDAIDSLPRLQMELNRVRERISRARK